MLDTSPNSTASAPSRSQRRTRPRRPTNLVGTRWAFVTTTLASSRRGSTFPVMSGMATTTESRGIYLVLAQRGNTEERESGICTRRRDHARLKRENDTWVSMDEGYIDRAARTGETTEGRAWRSGLPIFGITSAPGHGPVRHVVPSAHRHAGDAGHIAWPGGRHEERDSTDRWQGRVWAIHEAAWSTAKRWASSTAREPTSARRGCPGLSACLARARWNHRRGRGGIRAGSLYSSSSANCGGPSGWARHRAAPSPGTTRCLRPFSFGHDAAGKQESRYAGRLGQVAVVPSGGCDGARGPARRPARWYTRHTGMWRARQGMESTSASTLSDWSTYTPRMSRFSLTGSSG